MLGGVKGLFSEYTLIAVLAMARVMAAFNG